MRRFKTCRIRPCGYFAVSAALTLLVTGIAFHADKAQAADDNGKPGVSETSSISPLHTPDSDKETSLPGVLSDADAARYAKIFDLQKDGRWKEADRLIDGLSNDVLMGHVLFQRYMHPTAYRSKYLELKRWMEDYADHPEARRIYSLALRRRPTNYRYPPEPLSPKLPSGFEREEVESKSRKTLPPGKFAGKNRTERSLIQREQRRIRSLVYRGRVTFALERLSKKKYRNLFDAVSYAESLGVIARGYYRYHYDDKALNVVDQAYKLAGDSASNALWWGGLAAWRKGDFSLAGEYFSNLARAPAASDSHKAAGAFWASRSYLRAGLPARVNPMLKLASDQSRTFYGLLATEALGLKPAFDFDGPDLSETDVELLLRIPAAKRAIALFQAGQTDRADAELRRFVNSLPPAMAATLLAFADRAGLADLAYRIGSYLERHQGMVLDSALFPLPGWAPEDGFQVDQALIFALVRQESRFRARARSYAGARGLMQLMPATAEFMAGQRIRGNARAKLYEPSYNLSLGQKYIRHLLDTPTVGENLFFTIAAYNGGPGNLQKWMRKIDFQDDPLLFIESLPARETRNYIEHVMANLWIYRMRLGEEASSLSQLVSGEWPVYESKLALKTKVASAEE